MAGLFSRFARHDEPCKAALSVLGYENRRRIYPFAGICGANNKWVCCQPCYGLGIACQSITAVFRAMQ